MYETRTVDRIALEDTHIIYLPAAIDSIITSNTIKNTAIFVNNEKIVDFAEGSLSDGTLLTYTEEGIAGMNVWHVTYNGTLVGKLLFHRNDSYIVTTSITDSSAHDLATNIGTTR